LLEKFTVEENTWNMKHFIDIPNDSLIMNLTRKTTS